MLIHRIINKPVPSNCYVISLSEEAIVVDPGTAGNEELIDFLEMKGLRLKYVILTHEHFDHCAGINSLYEYVPFDVICSRKTSARIQDSKQNLSAYADDFDTFNILHQTRIVNNEESLIFGEYSMKFYDTPGHSPGSMCFSINNTLFSGDTLMSKVKTPLKLPGGNKVDYENSINYLQGLIRSDCVVYPGHGDIFTFEKGLLY